MAMCSFSTSYCNSSALSRIDPSYNTPNALGTISVYVNKIGNVSYYVAKRYLGLLSGTLEKTFAPLSIATNSTFIDSSLNANTKYTYAFIATDSNGYSASANVPTTRGGNGDGSIYTLADPSGLILAYNGVGSAKNIVSFTYTGSTTQTYSSLLIYDSANTLVVTSAPAYSTNAGTYTSTANTIAGVTTTVNTIYTYHVYVVNAAGLGNNISVCMKNINTCTYTDSYMPSSGTFCVPDTLGAIWNRTNNYSIKDIIASTNSKYSYYTVTRLRGTTVEAISSPQYGTNYSDLSTNLLTNTEYTFKITICNQLDYPCYSITTTTNNKGAGAVSTVGKIYTLADPDGLIITYLSVAGYVLSYMYSGKNDLWKNFVSSINNTINLANVKAYTTTPTNVTFTAVAGTGTNVAVTYYHWVLNNDNQGGLVDVCRKTTTNYTQANGANNTYKVAVPIALNTIRDSNGDTITGFNIGTGNGTYSSYIVTRTGGAGTVTSTVQTGTSYQDTSTDLLSNTLYKYTYQVYNNDGFLYPLIAGAGWTFLNYMYSPYTSTTLTTTTAGTCTLFDNSIISVSSWAINYYTLTTPKVYKLTVNISSITGTQCFVKCIASWSGISSTVYILSGGSTLITIGTTIPTSGFSITLNLTGYNVNNIYNSLNPKTIVLNYN